MPHPLIHVLHRRIGAGWFEETLSFVVVAVGLQQAGSTPDLDRIRCDVEFSGDLTQVKQAASTEPSVSILEAVRVSNPGDDLPIERQACPRRHAALVEQRRDLAVGVILEEAIDRSYDIRRRRPPRLG
jgi:hypothetical protein